jgi:DinB family protein
MPADDAAAVIAQLGPAYRQRLRDFATEARVRDEPDLIRVRPSPDTWCALEYTAHMRDVVDFYMDRIERVLRENRPILPAADFDSMAETRRYRDEDVETVLGALDRRSTAAAVRLGRLEAEDWGRVGLGSEGGERTVLVLARRLAHDGHHHLMDLERVLAGLTNPGVTHLHYEVDR